MNRRIRFVPFIVCAMFSLLVVCMGPVLAMEVGPTPFQRAIASWMGVVALVAEDGAEADEHEDDDEDEDEDDDNDEDEDAHHGHGRGGERAEWGGRGRRGMGPDRGPGAHDPRPHGPAPRGPGGPPAQMRMEHMQRMRADSLGRVSEIIDRLTRIEQKLDAASGMGNPWSPRPA